MFEDKVSTLHDSTTNSGALCLPDTPEQGYKQEQTSLVETETFWYSIRKNNVQIPFL